MRVRNFEQNISLMPDGMAKQILLKIVNTPRPDFTELDKECDEYVMMRFKEMTPEERVVYFETMSPEQRKVYEKI